MPDSETTTLTRAVLLDAFGRIHERVPPAVDGLSEDQLAWRPDPGANPIGWLVWHLTRVQDDHLAALATACGRPREQVWPRWRERFGLPYPPDATGYGQTSEEVGAFRATAALLVGYHEEVDAMTTEVVGELTPEDYTRVVDEHWDPPVTAAARLVSVIGDGTAHIGQAEYVRGMLERR